MTVYGYVAPAEANKHLEKKPSEKPRDKQAQHLGR